MRTRTVSKLLLTVSMIAGLSCSTAPRFSPDPWYAPPPPPYPIECSPLPPDSFVEVSADTLLRFAGALEQTAAVPVAPQQLSAILPADFRPPTDRQPYLLRALFLNRGTGAFSVCSFSDGVLVSHVSLGAHPAPMQRSALVAFLSHAPTTVYVDVSMAR